MTEHNQSTSLPHAALQLTGVSLLSQFLYFLYQVALSHIVGTEGLGWWHMVLPIYYTLLAFLTSGFCPGHLQTMLRVPVPEPVQRPNRHRQQHPLPFPAHPPAGGLPVLAGLPYLRQPVVGRSAAGWVCVGAAAAVVFYRVGDLQ